MEGKKCTSCGETHPLSLMVKNCQMVDGYLPLCKKCKREKYKTKNIKSEYSCSAVMKKSSVEYHGDWLGDNALYL